MKGRIVIVDDEPITRLDIKDMLIEADYEICGEAADGFEAVEICRKEKPDLVLMDIQMPILDGLKAAKKIAQDKLACSIVFLTAYSDSGNTEKAKKIGATGYLVKPIDEKSLIPTIEVAIAKGKQTQNLEAEIEALKTRLEERKIIEKAKGVLGQSLNISEDEAYRHLRKLSMDKRAKMKEIAELILMYND